MKKIISKIKWSVLGVFLPMITMAAVGDVFGGQATTVEGAGGTLPQIIGRIINYALGVVGLIAVVMAIVGGIILATSGGDEGKVTSGKNYITYGLFGLIVSLIAYALVGWVVKGITGA